MDIETLNLSHDNFRQAVTEYNCLYQIISYYYPLFKEKIEKGTYEKRNLLFVITWGEKIPDNLNNLNHIFHIINKSKNCQSKYVFMLEPLFQTFHLHSSQQQEVAIESIQPQTAWKNPTNTSERSFLYFPDLSFSNDS
jgi:hypothetical protein